MPDRLDRLGPTHLIVAIEVSGTPDHVLERIDRAGQLIRRAAEGADAQLRVSLLSYGPHKVLREDTEEPVRRLAWASTPDTALDELTLLADQGPAPLGYRRAAQLECLLTMLTGQVREADGRPVLVTIGSRPAFPYRVDRRSEIIPCKYRHDWRIAMDRLRRYPGIRFGAIRDHGQDDEIWAHLGSAAFARLSTVDVRRFAIDLGLYQATVHAIPFPLRDPEGA